MEIFTLLETLEDILERSKSVPFTEKAIVDKEEVLEIIKDIRLKLPDELKQAKWIKEERGRILQEAQKEADDIVREAENRIISMIDEHEITRKAYEQKAEIIETANEMSREISKGTKDYADNITSTTVNIESRTEYGYQEVTQWDSEYDLTKPSDGYYKTKNQYQLSYQVDEWIQENPGKGGTEYSGIQSSNGNMVNNQLTKHIYFGKTVRNIVGTYTPYSVRYENPSNQYSWNFTLLTPPGDSTSRYVGDNTNTRYNFPKNTTPVTEFSYIIKANGRPSSAYEADVAWNISSWEYLSHKTLMTDWQDSNVDIPEGTFVGIANTREVYAKALSWGPSMGWNPDTPYTQTPSIKPVTRITIHFAS